MDMNILLRVRCREVVYRTDRDSLTLLNIRYSLMELCSMRKHTYLRGMVQAAGEGDMHPAVSPQAS